MERDEAIKEIRSIFSRYRAARRGDKKLLEGLSDGKLYELFVLSDVISKLGGRGFDILFRGTTLKFKGGPGMIKTSDPHFELRDPSTNRVEWRVFVDIEFNTLGFSHAKLIDDSRRHEIDIIVTKATGGYPNHDEVALGVECKSTPNFDKGLIKEALGVRRELCYFDSPPRPAQVVPAGMIAPDVYAFPPSEFWLAHLDAGASRYKQSPGAFSIELLHLEP